MGERAALLARLDCICQVCLTWRRVGSLVVACHSDSRLRHRAVQVLRFAASELADEVELSVAGTAASLAGEAAVPPVALAGGAGIGKKEGEGTSEGAEETERSPPDEERENAEAAREVRGSEEGRKSQTKSSSKKDKKKRRSDKESKRDKRPASRSRRRDKSVDKRERPSSPRSPPRSSTRRDSGEAFLRVKSEEKSWSEEEGPPPGQWTLTEVPGEEAPEGPRSSAGSARPPEPAGPPPGWTGPIFAPPRRSRGVVRRERARDINLFGFNPERKRVREERRGA